MSNELWVVMPVYNERDSIALVLREWVSVLRAHAPGFVLCVLNDGSRDDTLALLQALQAEMPELRVIDKPNSGHGQTCIEGYRLALAAGASWIFQIDSDGQCDPRFFPALWHSREGAAAIYGFRATRDDGAHRRAISRVTSAVGWLAFGIWVRDANVPYRLMRRDAVEAAVPHVARDFFLANVLVALLQERDFGIRWQDIGFRKRHGGTPSVRALSFARRGTQLFQQLRAAREQR